MADVRLTIVQEYSIYDSKYSWQIQLADSLSFSRQINDDK